MLGAAAAGLAVHYSWSPRIAPPGQPALTRLSETSLAAFQRSFNDAADSVRVILLLSPT